MEGGYIMILKNLIGQRFGKLTVLDRAQSKVDKSGRKRTMWSCQCDCGSDAVVVSADYLKRSECPSCGCEAKKNKIEKNRVNCIGEKFGRLTILDIIWDNKRSEAICKCDCGNDYIGVKSDIVSGHTKSCGCLWHETISAVNTKDWTGFISDYGVEFLNQDHMNKSGQWIWKCRCGCCGSIFTALPAKINNGHITSCGCRIQSAGEEYIKGLLEEFNINYVSQYTFTDCKSTYVLRFDFAIFYNNVLIGLIEYDGQQHFEPIDFFGGKDGFEKTKERDKIKNTYCQSHDIPLLRIPYTFTTNEIKKYIYEYYLSLTTAGCA